jgi:hypothetical protein
MMHNSEINAPKGDQRRSAAIWELHLNDGFKNAQDVAITGTGQMLKPKVFTWIYHTKPPSNNMDIVPATLRVSSSTNPASGCPQTPEA